MQCMEEKPDFEIGLEVLSKEIAGILRGLGEEHGFDELTCEEIESMPYEEAFDTAYGYITQAGLDADEILAALIEQPEE
jgi:hypothetical protein